MSLLLPLLLFVAGSLFFSAAALSLFAVSLHLLARRRSARLLPRVPSKRRRTLCSRRIFVARAVGAATEHSW